MPVINNRQDLLTRYRNNNLFIDAGAGAGKTQFISDKVVDLIIQGVEVNKIVLITFTNKAAEEMLGRISKNILKVLKEGTLSQTDCQKLQLARDNLFKLNVSTIHSFCNKLINENSFAAEVTYNPSLLEEDDEEKRRLKYFNNYIKTLSHDDFNLIHKFAFSRNPIGDIKKIYLELCKHLPEENFVTTVISDEDFTNIFNSINDIYLLIQNNIGKCTASVKIKEFNEKYDAFIKALTSKGYDLSSVIAGLSEVNIVRTFIDLVKISSVKTVRFNKGNKKSLGAEPSDANDKIARKQKTPEEYSALLTIGNRYINKYAKDAYDYFIKNFERDEMSNNYLIFLTYNLIKSSEDIKNKLAYKYDVIIVDEFQDTDRFQISFVDLLAKAIDKRKALQNIKTTSLVVVGDPKQSIYRFRGADVNSFINFRDASKISKENLFLPQNFRSNNYIINYINNIFINKTFHLRYPYQNMTCAASNQIPATTDVDDKLAGVYSFQFNLPWEANPKEKGVAELKANSTENKKIRLAKLVHYLVEHKYKIFKKPSDELAEKNDWDSKQPRFLEIEYSDFLIITHGKKEISDIALEFNKLGIKTEISGQFDLGSSEIFNAIYTFVSYALNQERNNYLNLKLYFNMIWPELSKESNKDYDKEFKLFIDNFLKNVQGMTPYGVLMYVTHKFLNKSVFVSNYIDSDSDLYNCVVYEMLEKLNIDTNCDAIHLLNELDDLIANIPEQQISLNRNKDAVRIMNVHKSKGLEGNVVILFDSGGEKNSEVLSSCDNVIYLSTKDKGNSILHGIELEEVQEKRRLEYVAMSRAKSVLIVERHFNSNHKMFVSAPDGEDKKEESLKNYYDFSETALNDYHLPGTKLPTPGGVNPQTENTAPAEKNPKVLTIEDDEFALNNINEIKKLTVNCYSPSSKENHETETGPSTKLINRPKNSIFGDCLHRSMELLINDYSRSTIDIVNQAYIEKATKLDNKGKERYIKYLTLMVDAIKKLYSSMPDFDKYDKYPEYKFCTFINERNELINGSIDLLMVKDNQIKIIDYKSDISDFNDVTSFEEILKNKYKDQLNLYKEIVSKVYPSSTIDLSIILVEEDKDNQIAHELKL